MTTLLVLLQAAQQGAGWQSMIMIGLLILIFYFMMIRPQQKKAKEIRKQREAMKAGDRVVTAGGIFGKIDAVKENSFIIEIASGVKIRVDKNSVYNDTSDIQAVQK